MGAGGTVSGGPIIGEEGSKRKFLSCSFHDTGSAVRVIQHDAKVPLKYPLPVVVFYKMLSLRSNQIQPFVDKPQSKVIASHHF